MNAENLEVSVNAADVSQMPVFRNLIQFYLYDMAAMSAFPVNEQGLYDYDYLDRFWECPYLIHLNKRIAGFALIVSHSPMNENSPCWFMAEFCVLRPYRKQGVGRSAFRSILSRHPGKWEIAWQESNSAASEFWPASIPHPKPNRRCVVFDGVDWRSISFTAASAQEGGVL